MEFTVEYTNDIWGNPSGVGLEVSNLSPVGIYLFSSELALPSNTSSMEQRYMLAEYTKIPHRGYYIYINDDRQIVVKFYAYMSSTIYDRSLLENYVSGCKALYLSIYFNYLYTKFPANTLKKLKNSKKRKIKYKKDLEI